MNIPKAERDENNQYPGSLSDQMTLGAEEKRAVRRVLADSDVPLHFSQIAAKAGISMMTPQKQTAFSNFLEVYLVSTKEASMAFEPGRKGEQRFVGWKGSDHLRDLIHKGLA